MRREALPEHYNNGLSHGQGNLESLKIWQARIVAAGSVQRFLEIWSPRIIERNIKIPRPEVHPQRVPIRAIVGEINLH